MVADALRRREVACDRETFVLKVWPETGASAKNVQTAARRLNKKLTKLKLEFDIESHRILSPK
jgi:hypothetical protein